MANGFFFTPKSRFAQFNISVCGKRFQGSTGLTREAGKRAIAAWIANFKKDKAAELSRGTPAEVADMIFATAARRYAEEVLDRKWSNENTRRGMRACIDRLIDRVGTVRMRDIDNNLMLTLVEERCRDTVQDRGKKLVTPRTVNATLVQPMHAIHKRAALWGVPHLQAVRWQEIYLDIPRERIREVQSSEEAMVAAAFADRPHYDRFVRFARATGLRLSECLIRWADVDWQRGRISSIGKGQKQRSIPISEEVREILEACQVDNPTEHVFTTFYAGEVRPLTRFAVSWMWKELRKQGKLPADFRIHDLRHDMGTKLLRATGNLALVQKAMGHSEIKTTLRYAHVLDEDVAAAMEVHASKLAQLRRAATKPKLVVSNG